MPREGGRAAAVAALYRDLGLRAPDDPPEVLRRAVRMVRFRRGEPLAHESGEIADDLLLLHSGVARLEREVEGSRHVVLELRPGDVVGEGELLHGDLGRDTVVAAAPVEALAVERAALNGASADHDLDGVLGALRARARVSRLRAAAPLGSLAATALADLAARLEPERVPAGTTLIRAGETARSLYLILSGKARVLAGGPGSRVLVELLPGDTFGESALMDHAPVESTVEALTDLEIYRIDRATLDGVLVRHPQAATAVQAQVAGLALTALLRRSEPFGGLDGEALRRLADAMRRREVPTGETLFRTGDPGSAYYLVARGRVELRSGDQVDDLVDDVGPGEGFGEGALLSAEPHPFSAVAAEPSEVLELDRQVFLDVVRTRRRLRERVDQTLLGRQVPMRIPEWTASRQEVEDGEDVGVVYVVKDERRDLYVKLSERGYELWTEMDGQTSVRELVMDGFVRHGELALEQTLDLVQTLRTAGFVTTHRVAPAAPPPHTQPWYRRVVNFIGRIVGVIGRLLSFRFKIRRVDHWVGVLYRGGFHLLFRKEVQALLALFVASGLAWAGFLYFTDALPPVEPVSGLGWVGLYLFVILLSFAHELAHALTAKAAGREIREAGFQVRIGVPLVYLDTSDVWMASRKTRVAVSWAGPYFHLVVAAVVAWVLGVTPRLRESDALVGTLALNFTLFAANMFPLRELDGYYMLLDWFEAPRLRRKALSFLGLQSRKREPVRAWGKLERVYGAFGLVSAVYTLFLATQLLVGLQRTIGRIVGSVIDPTVGTGLGWLVGIVAGALFYLPSVQDLLRGRSADD